MTCKLAIPFGIHNTYDHPVLNISSSCAYLKLDVAEWLTNNFGINWKFKFENGYCIYFESESDKNWFIMRWL